MIYIISIMMIEKDLNFLITVRWFYMLVKELVEAMKKMPQDLEVVIPSMEYDEYLELDGFISEKTIEGEERVVVLE